MSETSISLFDCFSSVPDPRSPLGKRHPLSAVLTLCAVAMLCGCRSLYAIAQFGRDRGKHFANVLGFTRATTPCCTTLHNLFVALDKVAFEDALARWTAAAAQTRGWTTLSLDGKTLRGSLKDKLITGDAIFCQRDLSRKIRQKQGEYLWPVKDNQPDLLAAIEDAFDDADTSPSPAAARSGRASDRVHR